MVIPPLGRCLSHSCNHLYSLAYFPNFLNSSGNSIGQENSQKNTQGPNKEPTIISEKTQNTRNSENPLLPKKNKSHAQVPRLAPSLETKVTRVFFQPPRARRHVSMCNHQLLSKSPCQGLAGSVVHGFSFHMLLVLPHVSHLRSPKAPVGFCCSLQKRLQGSCRVAAVCK